MKYIPDKDLEFLQYYSRKDLVPLHQILGNRWTSSLPKPNSDDEYCYIPYYWQLLATDLQCFGGDTVLNNIRREGVCYHEIARDVAGFFEEKTKKADSIDEIENKIVKAVMKKTLKNMTDEQLEDLIKEFGINNATSLSRAAKEALIQSVIFGSRFFYIKFFQGLVSSILWRMGVRTVGQNLLTKILLGPWMMVASLITMVPIISGPAYRVTIPAVLQVALLRQLLVSLAILGERESGKTTLQTYLLKGELVTTYNKTPAPREMESKLAVRVQGRTYHLAKGMDVPGMQDFYNEWKKLVVNRRHILYVFRVDKLISGDQDVQNRIRQDLELISDWNDQVNANRPIFLIGTYCDQDPDFRNENTTEGMLYHDKIRGLPAVNDMINRCGGHQKAVLLPGSMQTYEYAEKLCGQFWEEVAKQ